MNGLLLKFQVKGRSLEAILIFSEQVWLLLQFLLLTRTWSILIDQISELIFIVLAEISIWLITWVNPLALMLIFLVGAVLSQLQSCIIFILLLRWLISLLDVHTFLTVAIIFFQWVDLVGIECLMNTVEIKHGISMITRWNRFGIHICLLNVRVTSKELCLTLDVMLVFF